MDVNIDLEPIQLVIFGAGGNLTWRKLMPVLYNLSSANGCLIASRLSASIARP
jgi:glucose-6-phosphate 1-dehydrogenase